MRRIDIIASRVQTLGANRLRAALTTLGIIIGVGSVVFLVAIGAGAQASIREDIERTGTNLVLIMAGAPISARPNLGPARGVLTDMDAATLRDEGYGVVAVASTVASVVQVATPARSYSSTLQGATEDFFLARNWNLASGRNIVEEDIETSSRVAMIGDTLSERVFPDQDPIGGILRVNQLQVEVIGVLKSKGKSIEGTDEDDIVIMPLRAGSSTAFAAGSVSLVTRPKAEAPVWSASLPASTASRSAASPTRRNDGT